jgi:hypothetical protein
LKECRAVGKELSANPPEVLKMLCRPLVMEFLELMAFHNRELFMYYDSFEFVLKYRYHLAGAYLSVFGRFIECLDIILVPEIIDELMVVQNLDRVRGLLELRVSDSIIRDQWTFVAAAIHHGNRLQIFKYRKYCTDNAIHKLRLHCPRLTEVDVCYSLRVTNASAPDIIDLKELKWLNLGETKIDDKNYGFIISKLPNIANIMFRSTKSSVLLHTPLKTLDTITHINAYSENMKILPQMCPNTTNITIHPVTRDLSPLTAFKSLHTLKIHGIHFASYNLRAVLSGIGQRLHDLSFICCRDLNMQDIVTLCPSLVNLSLIMCTYLRFNTPIDPQLPHFKNLINLTINSKVLHDRRFDYRYIRHHVSVETLHLKCVLMFTDEFVNEIVRLGTFKHLALFDIQEYSTGALSMEAIQLLIQHCPRLKRIEGLSSCPQLTGLHIEELKRQILQQNFDLEIVD